MGLVLAIGEAKGGDFLDPQPCKEDVGTFFECTGAVLVPQTEGLAAGFKSSVFMGTTSMFGVATAAVTIGAALGWNVISMTIVEMVPRVAQSVFSSSWVLSVPVWHFFMKTHNLCLFHIQ